MNFIQKGHYKNNNFNGSENESIQIIKILGEDIDNPGNWKTDELIKRNNSLINKTISEYELINNWTFIETSLKEDKKVFPKNLLLGLEENQELDFHNQIDIQKEIPLYKHSNTNSNKYISPEDIIPIFQIPEDEKFIYNVLNKIKITEKEYVEIKIRVPIEYNFNKLKETINLLNLDINKVIEFILSNNETKLLINEKMKDKLFEMLLQEKIETLKTNENSNIITNEKIKNIEVIEPTVIIQKKIEEKITEISDPRFILLNDKISKLF